MFMLLLVFKQKLVVRNTTGDNPIFLGPMMLHGSSTTVAYASFFCHLSAVLKASNCDKLVIGKRNLLINVDWTEKTENIFWTRYLVMTDLQMLTVQFFMRKNVRK